jgi:ankyrin repeat protein
MSDTPLMQAIASENIDLVRILIESGLTNGINETYEREEINPLCLAVMKKNIDLIKILLENGAKDAINTSVKVLDAPTSTFVAKTPLSLAIEGGDPEIIKLVIENGATDKCKKEK